MSDRSSDDDMPAIYFNRDGQDDHFSCGLARAYGSDRRGETMEWHIDEYLYAALFWMKIVDEFDEVPHNARYGWGPCEEGVILCEGLREAAGILLEAANSLREDQTDMVAGWGVEPRRVVFRIKADLEEQRARLRELARFFESVYRTGQHVQLLL